MKSITGTKKHSTQLRTSFNPVSHALNLVHLLRDIISGSLYLA